MILYSHYIVFTIPAASHIRRASLTADVATRSGTMLQFYLRIQVRSFCTIASCLGGYH